MTHADFEASHDLTVTAVLHCASSDGQFTWCRRSKGSARFFYRNFEFVPSSNAGSLRAWTQLLAVNITASKSASKPGARAAGNARLLLLAEGKWACTMVAVMQLAALRRGLLWLDFCNRTFTASSLAEAVRHSKEVKVMPPFAAVKADLVAPAPCLCKDSAASCQLLLAQVSLQHCNLRCYSETHFAKDLSKPDECIMC